LIDCIEVCYNDMGIEASSILIPYYDTILWNPCRQCDTEALENVHKTATQMSPTLKHL